VAETKQRIANDRSAYSALAVSMRCSSIRTTTSAEQGDDFTFWHREEEIILKNGQSQQRDLSPS
jgi:hypothetical protein